MADMGENAEFEKLSTLEARLAAALDRIAVGLGEAQETPAPMEEMPGITSAALEDAEMRADAAEARVAELQAKIAEMEAAQPPEPAPAPEPDTSEIDAMREEKDSLQTRVTDLESQIGQARAESEAALAARAEEVTALEAKLDEATAQIAAAEAEPEALDNDEEKLRMSEEISALQGKVNRMKSERDAAIAERDDARSIAEEMQVASGSGPDDRAMALRSELNDLRIMNGRLTRNLTRLRGRNATEPSVLNRALLVELEAVKAARASEAAELARLVEELQPAVKEEG